MIRVAGPQNQLPPELPVEPEVEVPMEEAPVKTLYAADKQMIMEAMTMIQQALEILMEVCPPEEYQGQGRENEEIPTEDVEAPEEPEIPEEGLV